jgi:hypothetical protein
MSEKPHCIGNLLDRRLLPGMKACWERLRTLIKSSDDSLEKFWRLTLASRVLLSMVSRGEKAMKMQVGMDVCTVKAGQCIQ